MASGKSNYLAQKLLNNLFGLSSYTVPANFYAALFTTSPGAGNTGVELSGNGYARVAIPGNGTYWSLTAQTLSNLLSIAFPVFTGGTTGTVLSVGLYDASSSGNLLYFADLASAYQKTYTTNDQPIIPAGGLTITES
jgi:hypothetical protein